MRSSLIASVLALGLGGCLASAPRYPAYYRGWETMPPELVESLDEVRIEASENPRDSEALLRYARFNVQLTRQMAQLWFETSSSHQARPEFTADRVSRSRIRLLETCRQTLALYTEYRLIQGPPPWTDRLEIAWLLTLQGFDQEGHEVVRGLLNDPTLPPSVHDAVRRVSELILSLPSDGES